MQYKFLRKASMPFSVTPATAGVHHSSKIMDSRVSGNDESLGIKAEHYGTHSHAEGNKERKSVTFMNIYFTDYLQYRTKIRGFDITLLEDILRYSPERYRDTETGRAVVVGKHQNTLVLIPYEKNDTTIIPITVHATSRQQIKFRLQTARLVYESTTLF